MKTTYIPIDELVIYKLAMEIGEEVWCIVEKWEYHSKNTIGRQFCAAADSIAANIAEGHGRFYFKENRQFCFYARGSLMETKSWLQKAANRHLVDEAVQQKINEMLKRCHWLLNRYIKSIGTTQKNAPQ